MQSANMHVMVVALGMQDAASLREAEARKNLGIEGSVHDAQAKLQDSLPAVPSEGVAVTTVLNYNDDALTIASLACTDLRSPQVAVSQSRLKLS